MPARRLTLLAVTVPTALVLAAGCSGSSADTTVQVTATADACTLDSTTLDAGTIDFDVKNSSGKEAEAYVYKADGDMVDEVEGIADGTSRTLTVDLEAGDYEFACKPEGDDVRTPFTVS